MPSSTQICKVVSHVFYDGGLKTAAKVLSVEKRMRCKV